ncbi:DUF2339 domain-containing protein [Luteimonas sp. RIT-PG2_3]
MESIIGLAVLVVLAVPVLLIVALVSISGLKARVGELEVLVGELEVLVSQLRLQATPARPASAAAPAAADRPDTRVAQPPAGDGAATRNASPPAPAAPAPASGNADALSYAERLQASLPPGPATPAATLPDPLDPLAPLDSLRQGSPPPLPPRPVAAAASTASVAAPRKAGEQAPPRRPRSAEPTAVEPAAVDVFLRAVKRWFTTGNIPVKVGMLVLLAGVASLLKYATDEGWFRFPIELRLAGIAMAALAALVFGWRQRSGKPAFALALQGGAIGILLLTVFAAFKLYALIDAGPAFALTVLLVAGLGVLAVLQDSRTLAVLGILAGFLAPIWLSTGSGNHVALFSYYAVLNVAIFAIAWTKSWRVLNLLGFAFTWGIGTVWGVLDYTPAKLASTQPFLLLFFVFYLLLPILHARRSPASRRDLIDGCLVFGTPLIAFSLQAGLLHGERMTLALCALGLGVLYAALAWATLRRERLAALGQCYALLAVGFATLAVPLGLSANATACVFALEGAALAWLGLRQQRWLPQVTGLALQVLAGVSYLVGIKAWQMEAMPIFNAAFMGALLMALAGWASAWAYRQRGQAAPALAYYLWALAWWCGAGLHQIERYVEPDAVAVDWVLGFVALTGWLAAEVHRRAPARVLAGTSLVAIAMAVPLAFVQDMSHQHPFGGLGLVAWALFALLGLRSLVCLRDSGDARHAPFAAWAQLCWWIVWAVTLTLSALWLAGHLGLGDGWHWLLVAAPWLVLAAISILAWPLLRFPVGERFDALRLPLQVAVFLLIAAWWLGALMSSGGSSPLPWLPLVNPLDLAQVAAMVLATQWVRSPALAAWTGARRRLLPAAAFVLITTITLRGVHQLGGVAWDSTLLGASLAQTSLTVVWSILGVSGWIIGSRRGRRGLWLAGALLMAVVLAKLVLVDRQHLGNLLGIGSFIAYGLLCTLVGYLAPAPPRDATAAPDTRDDAGRDERAEVSA